MKKIIAMLRPFDMAQTLMVYEDGNKIDMVTTELNFLHPAIFSLVDKYEINQLDLVGPKKYLQGIREQIQEAEAAKYDYARLQINII